MNVGVFFCSLPWTSVDVSGSAVISFGVTVGIYTASIVFVVVVCVPSLMFSSWFWAVNAVHPVDWPFESTARSTIPSALPTKPASGVNVTLSSVTVYVPWPALV